MSDINLWLFIAYVVGTLFGLYATKSKFNVDTTKIIEATIDRLISDDYIKVRHKSDGEIELIKHNE